MTMQQIFRRSVFPLLSVALLAASLAQAQNPTPSIVHSFSGPDGANPGSSLVELPNGNLMGMTWSLETNPGTGTLYTLDAAGTLTTTYTFAAGTPLCAGRADSLTDNGLFQASNGLIYGLCFNGGQNGLGSVYVTNSSGTSVHLLHSFNGTDGSHPVGPLVEGADGDLYGATQSTVFKMTLGGSVTALYTFVKGSGPWEPLGGLTLAPDENLYGLTGYDDSSYEGSGYQINNTGALAVLGNFYAAPFGQSPVVTSSYAVETICQPTLGVGAGETVETVNFGDNKRVVYGLPQYFGPDFVNLVGGLVQGGDGALYLNGSSIVGYPPPVNPSVIARIDVSAKTTQFAGADSSIGTTLVGNPLETANGTIYSAAQTGGPSGLGSVLAVNFGNPAPAPGILFFQPSSGAAKTVVTIWGSHFVGATSVTVGGKPVPFTIPASGFVKLEVTRNAVTGPVAVTTPGGVATSTGVFTVQ